MANTERIRIRIVGVSCATCIIPIRRALEKREGIKKIGANYVADLIMVYFDPEVLGAKEIISIIRNLGYKAIPIS
ncbi:MAG: heavy metal-associated domain-containing protein [Nitrososphaerales archaeon]